MFGSDQSCSVAADSRTQRLEQAWTHWTSRRERRRLLKKSVVIWHLCIKSRGSAKLLDGDDDAVISALDRLRETANSIRASPRTPVPMVPAFAPAARPVHSNGSQISFRGVSGCYICFRNGDSVRLQTTERDALAALRINPKPFIVGMQIKRSLCIR